MTKQEIIERIKKVKRLAESGVEGEKENAQSMVDELMNQYGITESDLEDEKEEVYTYYKTVCSVGSCLSKSLS